MMRNFPDELKRFPEGDEAEVTTPEAPVEPAPTEAAEAGS